MGLFTYPSLMLGVVCLLSYAPASFAHRPSIIGRAVNTTSGLISGHAAPNRTEVSEYLGIRFAQPPLGHLRFAAPEAFRSSAVFNASSFEPSCLATGTAVNYSILTADGYHLAPTAETFLNAHYEKDTVESEDCLTLNVWTKLQTGEKAEAVLFYIYGGVKRIESFYTFLADELKAFIWVLPAIRSLLANTSLTNKMSSSSLQSESCSCQ